MEAVKMMIGVLALAPPPVLIRKLASQPSTEGETWERGGREGK
jgi:hypothetical protein